MLLSSSLLKIPTMFLVIGSGWRDGFHHSLEGWVHILIMIAVGVGLRSRVGKLSVTRGICQHYEFW